MSFNNVSNQESLQNKVPCFDDNLLFLSDFPIKEVNRVWLLHQALLRDYLSKTDEKTREQLELAILHSYTRVASFGNEAAEELGVQTSPFFSERSYFRIDNGLKDVLDKLYANDMKKNEGDNEILLLNDFSFRDVLRRSLPGEILELESITQFENLIDQFFEDTNNLQPFIWIDFSNLISQKKLKNPKEVLKNVDTIEALLSVTVSSKILKMQSPFLKKSEILDDYVIEDLVAHLQPFAFFEYKGQCVLFLPGFLKDEYSAVINQRIDNIELIAKIRRENGYCLSPDETKKALLNITKLDEILTNLKIPSVQLAIKGKTIPKVCESFADFIAQPVVNKFCALSEIEEAPPYLRILPQATVDLLIGLGKENVEKIFQKKGLEGLLQTAYFGIFNAMNEAILHKDDLIEFVNYVELIHQIIQSILAIAEPYREKDFENAVLNRLLQLRNPIFPDVLGAPRVHLKASAMHSLASILSGVENEKGDNNLNVAILNDSYYETSDIICNANNYNLFILNGADFRENKDVKKSFALYSECPIDLFLCEFHHNLSKTCQEYHPENVLNQVKDMIAQKLTAEKFTVVIDTTIGLEQSYEIRQFLADEVIQATIQSGNLNVVFLRSGQKFDMLGMDNYYGGITLTVNYGFKAFNQRMDEPEDQLKGLSYQGMTHLQRYGGSSQESHRLAAIRNTNKLYDKIPNGMIFYKNTKNPIQVSKREDKLNVFLDVKIPVFYSKTAETFIIQFYEFVGHEMISYTKRPSFGFITPNWLVLSEDRKFQSIRLNPGLESEEVINQVATFFERVQQAIDSVSTSASGLSLDDLFSTSIELAFQE